MKRFKLKIGLVLGVILFSLFLSACQPKFDSFVEGEYVTTNEVDNDIISKIRLELYNIDEQTYSKSNGVNVVCDFTKSGADKYFSFNLYLFVDELGEYCKIDLTNFEHLSHAPTYYCYPADKEVSSAISGIYNISAIAFEYSIGKYDTCFDVLLRQNGIEYYYQLSLVDNIV